MTSRLLVSISSPGRLSGCALAFLTVLSPTRNHVWASPNQFASNQTFGLRMSSTGTGTPTFTIAQFLCRSDKYGFLLHDPVTGDTCAIDTPCAKSYKKVLDERGWKLTHIFNTHHHDDHQGGNLELKTEGVTIVGPKSERKEIAGMDKAVGDGDEVQFGSFKAQVLDAGGHTHGHIAFHFQDQSTLFSGDCLFSLGCGRMFEGTPAQFWSSLERMRNLPDDTLVYW
jgi:hydroxyacylglutathione hydrolase